MSVPTGLSSSALSGGCRSSPRRAVNVFLLAITSVNYLSCWRRRIVLVCLLRLLHFPAESWGERWVEMNDRMDGWLSTWHLLLAAWSFNSVSNGGWREVEYEFIWPSQLKFCWKGSCFSPVTAFCCSAALSASIFIFPLVVAIDSKRTHDKLTSLFQSFLFALKLINNTRFAF